MSSQKFLFLFLWLAAVTGVLLGPYALEQLGIQYVSEGGNPIFKIHPFAYFTFLAFFVLILFNSIRGINNALGFMAKPWWFLLSAVFWLISYGFLRYGSSGMAYPIVTLLAPVLAFAIIPHLSVDQVRILKTTIYYLIIINAIVAIGEFSLGKRLWLVEFPEFGNEFRASALLGHPLSNALILAFMVPFFINFKNIPFLISFAIVFIGLLATGARSATAIMMMVMMLIAFIRYFVLKEALPRLSRTQELIYIPLFLILIVLLGYVIMETPIADRILNNLVLDESARARLDVFYVLDQMSIYEWIFGGEVSLLDSLTNIIGITVIENFIIGWIVQFGLIVTIPMVLTLIYFFVVAYRSAGWDVRMGILIFSLASITNNSLSSKTMALFILMLMIALLLVEAAWQSQNKQSGA